VAVSEPPPRRVVVHMDCDAFYATVELLRRPELAGKPVIVAGSGPRAVVTTASYEARRYGVGSAMPASRALRRCPQAIVIPPDFTAYREKSADVWDIVRERLQSPMQHVSLDEAYADVTRIDTPLRVLRALVAEVRERTGITISVGVGPSRLVAKTASDAEKPAGFVVLSREAACERFAGAPTRLLQGIGPRTQERLQEMGITTVAHLQAADGDALVARFGERMGRWLKARAFFHDSSPVEAERIAKSRSSETTFDVDVADLDALRDTVRKLAADVCEGLRRNETRGRTIGIKVRLDDWTNITRDRSIEEYTNDTERVTEVALDLLEQNRPARPVRLIGVRVALFEAAAPERPAPLEDFDGPVQLALPVSEAEPAR
jgi:DNA polymerase-4